MADEFLRVLDLLRVAVYEAERRAVGRVERARSELAAARLRVAEITEIEHLKALEEGQTSKS